MRPLLVCWLIVLLAGCGPAAEWDRLAGAIEKARREPGTPRAVDLARRQVELARDRLKDDPRRVALSYGVLERSLLETGRLDEAVPYQRHLVRLLVACTPCDSTLLGQTLNDLAFATGRLGLAAESESSAEHAVAVLEAGGFRDPYESGKALHNLAEVRRRNGDLEAAEALIRKGIDIRPSWKVPASEGLSIFVIKLAAIVAQRGRAVEADSLFRRAIQIDVNTLEPDNPRAALAHLEYGTWLVQWKRYPEALHELQVGLRPTQFSRFEGQQEAVYRHAAAVACSRLGYLEDARQELERAIEALRTTGVRGVTVPADWISELAEVYRRLGREDDARALLERGVPPKRRVLGS